MSLPPLFQTRILMCRPEYYKIKYEINPWMNVENQPSSAAAQQWVNLHHHIIRLGGCVEYIEPKSGLPDMVFTANGGLVHGNKVVLPKFKHKERQREKSYFKNWFVDHGFEVCEPRWGHFEGAGDALYAGDCWWLGYGFRSDLRGITYIPDLLGIKSYQYELCRLVDPYFYHLDTCFCPLRDSLALVYPDAFDDETLAKMTNRLAIVPVPPNEARNFACNAVVLGNDILIPNGCPLTRERLVEQNFRVYQLDMTDFIKAGGACKCLTLKLGDI
jgi:N-dimethylarginine dimethylaminohydrolase